MLVRSKGVRIDIIPEAWKTKEQFIKANLGAVKKLPEHEREKWLSDAWDKVSPPKKEVDKKKTDK